MHILKNKLRLSWAYLRLSSVLFMLEVLIERMAHDDFIRPYVGDFFVVMLLYTLIKSFWDGTTIPTALFVLVYSYLLEYTQYLHLSEHLGVENSWVGRLILGNYFAWGDLVAYTAGIIVVIGLEALMEKWTLQCKLS